MGLVSDGRRVAVTVIAGGEKRTYDCDRVSVDWGDWSTFPMRGDAGKVAVTGFVGNTEIFTALCDHYFIEKPDNTGGL